MNDLETYIRLRGNLYHGRLVYVGPNYLDPLSTMVLRAIAKEGQLRHLVAAKNVVFGLPQRLVEDIISDLIHRGLIMLNASEGICRVPQSVLERLRGLDDSENGVPAMYQHDDPDMVYEGRAEFWQDKITGRFLAWETLRPLGHHPDGTPKIVDLLPLPNTHLPKVHEVPDAQLVGALGTSHWMGFSLLGARLETQWRSRPEPCGD